ncbi:MAG: acetoin utilization protein acuB [Flavobacteriales bacterium CG03_land_8_20_14_0_80_35_15]|nr:acetoin utilization protein acuB [Zetaproteobacteria bacterium]PIR14600.1 MAG: acetoin utilization protein acuB [Flavobacteriales bacterium CG11_big_fil_rev_8_21_14_0_20_35_7]PIV17596.1 MAG: acetoin utilization protein acuB [Flavobacteriales bacterium CG03_land_8_20_14_0_80_35_15]PIX06205.1 MAG: acetoin utilization protein acuB [Flavobacteriales bacterium CG_4_8_14_3_um_filter_35_10]PJA06295.1 MAG: acetoin utilization protein acuB [Flavobacteriales bacterium CG_4_10_14_0_2_um_filter_35_18]
MDLTTYITADLKVLSLTDKLSSAKALFLACSFSHLPVVKDSQLIGLIAKNDFQDIELNEDLIEKHLDLIQHFSTLNTNVWINLIKLFATNRTNILPVIDDKQRYLGYYELNDILQRFLETPFLNEGGYLIIVEKNILEYSFSEISQIVEANNAKILGAFITKRVGDTVQITLKISDHDISNTLQSFRRYNYHVIAGNIEDQYFEQLKERSEYLQKYLNI